MNSLLRIALVAMIFSGCTRSPEPPALMVFCAANLKKPVESAAQQFRKETGIEVQLQFGGSGTLVSQFRLPNAAIFSSPPTRDP